MNMLTFLLVVWVTDQNGNIDRFILDSQLSYADCESSATSIQINTGRASYACVIDLSAQYVEPFTLLVDPSSKVISE